MKLLRIAVATLALPGMVIAQSIGFNIRNVRDAPVRVQSTLSDSTFGFQQVSIRSEASMPIKSLTLNVYVDNGNGGRPRFWMDHTYDINLEPGASLNLQANLARLDDVRKLQTQHRPTVSLTVSPYSVRFSNGTKWVAARHREQ